MSLLLFEVKTQYNKSLNADFVIVGWSTSRGASKIMSV